MEVLDHDRTFTDLTNDAAELAARALGCGLARLVEAYVPPRLVRRFAMRVAVALVREANAADELIPHVVARGTH